MKNLIPLELHSIAINEGVMSEIHIMAQEARNVKEFIKEFMAEYGDKVKDNAETRKWLESMYNDTVNEKSKGLWANIHAKRKKGKKPARKGSKAYKKAKAAADKLNNESVDLDIDSLNSKELKEISVSIENFKLLSRNEQDLFLKNYSAILPSNMVSILKSYRVDEAFIGPFVFNDKMSDEELKAMYQGALDGYANHSKGFEHPKSKYKQAYQAIEKILKKRGVSVDEAVELVHVYKDGKLFGTGELVKGKDKKIKGKKHQLIRFDGSTEDYYPAEDVKLVESVNEGEIADTFDLILKTIDNHKKIKPVRPYFNAARRMALKSRGLKNLKDIHDHLDKNLKDFTVTKISKGNNYPSQESFRVIDKNRKIYSISMDLDEPGEFDVAYSDLNESLNEKKAPFPYNLGYNGRNDHFKYAEEIGMAVKDIEGIRDYHKMAQRGGKTAVQDLSSRILITTYGQPEIKDAIVKALKGVDDNIDLKTIKSNYDAPDRERSKHEQDNDMWKWEIQKKEDFHSYKRKYGDAPKPDREFTRDHQMEFIDMLAPYSTTQHQLADIDITSLEDFLQYAADHVSPANLKKVTKRIKKEYPKLESVQFNEGKMPERYVGLDDIVYVKVKEDSRGANYKLYWRGHDVEVGGRRFANEKELKSFASDFILSNQVYNKLKYKKPQAIPESKHILTLESFLNEALPTQEIDPDKFPDQWKKDKEFFKQGYKDGSNVDDTVETRPVKIPASQLKPSQDAVYLGKALGMAIGGVEGGSLDAIISQDNRILDGHHRWAATIFNNPKARVGGVQAQLKIGDLVPVLRQAGDALGNNRGLPPKGGDVNIFKATLQDVRDAVYDGKHMNPQFYNREQAIEWFERTGEKKIQSSLNILQRVGPPAGAPPRAEMPRVTPDQVKNVANKLAGGAIDVRKPYVGDPAVKGKGGLQNYLN